MQCGLRFRVDAPRRYALLEQSRCPLGLVSPLLPATLRQPAQLSLAQVAAELFQLLRVHDVLAGLEYAHSRVDTYGRPMHIVHRDVNPRNIMLSIRGEVKLIDFGLSVSLGGVHSRHRDVTGTLRYGHRCMLGLW